MKIVYLSILCLFFITAEAQVVPSDINGLTLWYNSDSIKISGGLVDTLYDLSQNQNDATQLNNTNKGVLQTGSSLINHQNIVIFNGNNHYNLNSQLNLDSLSVFFVAKNYDNVNSSVIIGNTAGWYDFVGVASTYTKMWTSSQSITLNMPANDYVLGGFIYNGSTAYAFGNATYSTSTNLSDKFVPNVIGRYALAPEYSFEGAFGELIIFNRTLSAGEQLDIINYLRNKYAPPVTLGQDIVVAHGFCDTVLNASDRFTGYLWSTGETSSTIDVDRPGNYWVQTQDVFGFITRDTITVNMDSPLSLSNSTICKNNFTTLNTGLNTSYQFNWSTGETTSSINVSGQGDYYCIITDTFGCSISSDTAFISINNFSDTLKLGNDTSLCAGNSIQIIAGQSQAVTYLWLGGSTNNSLTIDTTGIYTVTVTNSIGCIGIDTISVIITGTAPTASFSTSNVCIGDSASFIDSSIPPMGNTIVSWNWNFGDVSNSTQQNPKHLYTSTGLYNINLSVTTDAGCSSQITHTLYVAPVPTASFSISSSCENTASHFNDLSTSGGGIQTWQWDFGNASSGSANFSTLQNPNHLYGDTGSYTAQLIVNNIFGCTDTTTKNTFVKPSPKVGFYNSISCKNGVTSFHDTTVMPINTTVQNSYWNFGGGNTSTLLNPGYVFSSSVNYPVMHVITASNGCKDTLVKTVPVHPNPVAYFNTDNVCVNSPVQFNDLSLISGGSIANWNWTFGALGTSTIQHPQHSFSNTGNVNVKLVVISADGCKDSTTNTIIIHSNPAVSFNANPTYGSAPLTVVFSNTSSGAFNYIWDFGDGNNSLLANPANTYTSTGNYSVTLIGTNNFGCGDTTYKTIDVVPSLVDVAVFDIKPSLQNNFLNLEVELINKGTIDVTSLDFYIKMNNGAYIKEAWTGLLGNGSIETFTLSASPFVESLDYFICISAVLPNGVEDANPTDNELCKSLDESHSEVYSVFPNPAENTITIPFYFSTDQTIDITLYNSTGQKIKSIYSGEMGSGMHLIESDIHELNKGVYNLYIELKNEVLLRRFVKQ